jgi:2'-5' RNA ligase
VRIGVAYGIPEPWGSRLDRCRAESGDPLAAYIPAHLTLLGPTDVPDDALPGIAAHLGSVAAAHHPYPVRLHGTGTFRPVTEVVFVALSGGVQATGRLAGAVRSGPLSRELLFPYYPHVTVAHDVPAEALDAVTTQLADFSARFTLDHFTLYVHGADGHWRPVRQFPLAGRAPGNSARRLRIGDH